MNVNIKEKYTTKDFADALKELVEIKKWSYQQVADRAEVTKGYIGQIINRNVNTPKNKYIEKIAHAFGIEPEYFFEYRLRKFSELINDNRELLDECYSKINPDSSEKSA